MNGACRTASLPTLAFVLVFALAGAGCADTPRAVGGLQLGVDDAPLRPPVRIDEGRAFEYPPDAWEEGVGGTTVLRLLISRRGTVDSVVVIGSSGHPSLDSAALANARRLRYRPAAQGGTPVQVWGRLPVVFPIPEQEADTPHADTP
ncbi:MAG TPA: energy transducer TonB [Gemmatimonadota bacterium]|nr:energy transducer TonB [Gemmatimonadota bacterium]